MSERLAARLRSLLTAGTPAMLVEVEDAKGSTPREEGVAMLVTAERTFGTIGGGRLEWDATARAREFLRAGTEAQRQDLPLGPAIGQCCGGRVTLLFSRAGNDELVRLEQAEAAAAASQPQVLLFGAGHVGRALAQALAPLPLRLRWIDGRAQEFPDPLPPGVEQVLTEGLASEVRDAPASAAYLVTTHSHALDFEVCAGVLERGDFAYLGLIGSRSKRARFEHGFRELGIPEARIRRLTCPIGGTALRDKRPPVIAALAAAELLMALLGSGTAAYEGQEEAA